MFNRMSIAALIALSITLQINAQYYKVKWNAPEYGSSHGIINNSFYTVPNYKAFDMDNDGISEIIVYTNGGDSVNAAEIYDGATYKLKGYMRNKYIFSGNSYRPYADLKFVYGFYDIDGDNQRELVCAGTSHNLGDSNYFQGYLIINVLTDQIEFISDGSISRDFPPGFADIDNDGFIEMVTFSKIIGHSSTPVVQSPVFLKKIDPTYKIFPNPMLVCHEAL